MLVIPMLHLTPYIPHVSLRLCAPWQYQPLLWELLPGFGAKSTGFTTLTQHHPATASAVALLPRGFPLFRTKRWRRHAVHIYRAIYWDGSPNTRAALGRKLVGEESVAQQTAGLDMGPAEAGRQGRGMAYMLGRTKASSRGATPWITSPTDASALRGLKANGTRGQEDGYQASLIVHKHAEICPLLPGIPEGEKSRGWLVRARVQPDVALVPRWP